jgi:hypothetical protein
MRLGQAGVRERDGRCNVETYQAVTAGTGRPEHSTLQLTADHRRHHELSVSQTANPCFCATSNAAEFHALFIRHRRRQPAMPCVWTSKRRHPVTIGCQQNMLDCCVDNVKEWHRMPHFTGHAWISRQRLSSDESKPICLDIDNSAHVPGESECARWPLGCCRRLCVLVYPDSMCVASAQADADFAVFGSGNTRTLAMQTVWRLCGVGLPFTLLRKL